MLRNALCAFWLVHVSISKAVVLLVRLVVQRRDMRVPLLQARGVLCHDWMGCWPAADSAQSRIEAKMLSYECCDCTTQRPHVVLQGGVAVKSANQLRMVTAGQRPSGCDIT